MNLHLQISIQKNHFLKFVSSKTLKTSEITRKSIEFCIVAIEIEQYLFHHSQTNSTISWPVGELKFIGWESDNHFPYEKYTL